MASSNFRINTKDVSDLVDSLGITGGVSDLIKLGTSIVEASVEEKNSLVSVAEIYGSDYRLKLDDATRWLEEDGLKVEPVIVQPNIEYKDCSEFEVVATNFELGAKVSPGTRIIVKYVTSEVIEISQQMYSEAKQAELEIEQDKINRKEARATKNKETLDKTVSGFKSGFGKIVNATKEGVSKIKNKETTD